MKAIILTASLALLVASARADTTINTNHHYAYGANIGWIELRGDVLHGAVLGQSYLTGYVWSANCGWIGLGNGPANGWSYSNLSSNDWGVNHNGTGLLSGYAYGANIGWINFDQTYGRPRVDLRTGNLSGYIWGANIGWMGFSNVQAYSQTDRLDSGPDTDHDGIPDAWEYKEAGNLTSLWGDGHDADGDHMSDVAEYGADTSPLNDQSLLTVVGVQQQASATLLTWTIRYSRFYRLAQSTNLLVGTWRDTGLGLMSPEIGGTMTREIADQAEPITFYCPEAVIPLEE